MKKFLLILLIVSLHSFTGMAGQDSFEMNETFRSKLENDSLSSFRSRKGYLPTLIRNLGIQASFPFHLKEKDFFYFTAAAGIAITLHQFDRDIERELRTFKSRNSLAEKISPHFTELGDYNGYILLAGFASYSFAFRNHKALHVSLMASQAMISAAIWTGSIKLLTGRMRPEATFKDPEYNSDHWFGSFARFDDELNSNRGHSAFESFPSGHTSTIFAIASVFSHAYSEHKAMPYIMYTTAGLVGFTRMIEHQHWATDVFVGGIIGYLCGRQVVKNSPFMSETTRDKKQTTSVIFPFTGNSYSGVGWRLTF